RRSSRRLGEIQARGDWRRSGTRLLRGPWHGGRRQERARADRYGDRMPEQDGAEVGRARAAVRCLIAGAAADRPARCLPQQSVSPMSDARRVRLGISGAVAGRGGRPHAAHRQRDPVGESRRRWRSRRAFAVRERAHQEFKRASAPLFRRSAQHDGRGRACRFAREPDSRDHRARRLAKDLPRREGCGNTGVAISPKGMVTDPGAIADARSMLQQLSYLGDASRGQGEDLLSDAIKRFQEKAGLTADGKLTPTVLAVLRATKVAGLPIPGKTGLLPPVAPSATEHEAGSSFKDCETCPDIVSVPAGHFVMGSGKAEKGRQRSEEPQHEVTVPTPLAIGKYEVTFDEWEACALEGGCANYRPQDSGWGRARRPVIYVSYDDAKSYIEWLRQKSGKPYRLLSEAEWEFAARGGTSTPYAAGETLAPAQANFDASNLPGTRKQGTYQSTTVEVGTFPA